MYAIRVHHRPRRSLAAALALLGLALPLRAAALDRADADRLDCAKHLVRTRETVEHYWAFLLIKAGAHDLPGMEQRLRVEAQAATTADACADVLDRFMAGLRDGHANLTYFPGRAHRDVPPGIVLRSFAEARVAPGASKAAERLHVIRVDTTQPGLSADLIGAQVVAIDGVRASTALEHARARTSASTPWGLNHWADERLLLGPAGTPVTLTLRVRGETRDVTLARPGSATAEQERKDAAREDAAELVQWRRLEDGYGYLRLTTFGVRQAVVEFDAALDSLRDTRGLIIDVRDNGGGMVAALQDIMGRLVSGRTVIARLMVRRPGTEYVDKDFEPWTAQKRSWTYTAPVVLLVDGGCFSACDLFASALEETGRARLVGPSATGGGSASPASDLVSPGWNGVQVRMSYVIAMRNDGSHIENRGIRPHHIVRLKVKDYVEGRDPVLERALAVLASGEAKPGAAR